MSRSWAVEGRGGGTEAEACRIGDHSGGTIDTEPARVEAKVVVLDGAPIPVPMSAYVLLPLAIRFNDLPLGIRRDRAVIRDGVPGEGRGIGVTEHVEGVAPFGEQALGSTS